MTVLKLVRVSSYKFTFRTISLSGQEATMHVSNGSAGCVYSRCAAERCSGCFGCLSGRIWPTGVLEYNINLALLLVQVIIILRCVIAPELMHNR